MSATEEKVAFRTGILDRIPSEVALGPEGTPFFSTLLPRRHPRASGEAEALFPSASKAIYIDARLILADFSIVD